MDDHRHFILYKPYGFLSQFIVNGKHKKRNKLLGELQDFPAGTMSIGRLDLHSEGLLLLTTDGQQSHHITSRKVEKEYYAQVDGKIDEMALEKLRQGVEIQVDNQPYQTLPGTALRVMTIPDFPPRAKPIRGEHHGPTSWVSITIREGKFRQVRKMTAAIGFPTLRLVRVRIGSIRVDDLAAGEVREVDDFGVK